ncbi:MAG: cytochrome c oxidase accessory protein CcoG [Burkholderiales bacterium]|nr:cytochrome c oxidase accessory protein CcoG [Burkholderiales bacterium]OJX05613.1 MAG: cytochrome c oxidase accessory protein CcoG [Burkholderiales bacterium 70-64]
MTAPQVPARGGPAGEVEAALYEVRRKIYPRAVHGWFARWRWALVWFTQAIFYGLPWLSWGSRPAVLFDLEARRFYLFGIVLYPQDFIYLTGLLVISALALFLFTAVAGRLWCGYACPQTVYTEIFMWIEHRIEGDRTARMKLDRSPMSARKLALKGTKHLLWILVALWTGITFVGYFTPIRELLGALLTLSTGPWQTFWVLFYGFATWGNAGFLREQVCKYMCPYARFQGVMFDKDTLVITYDRERGEPRGPRSRKADPRGAGLGDCVDCNICVHVCPTGIDIRDGLQYECIGCAACIDGCNQVMDRMGYPHGLIRYTTENALERKLEPAAIVRRVLRPRVLVYSAVLLAATLALFGHLALRAPLKLDVIRDRALGREVEDGRIENGYQLQIINSAERTRRFRVTVSGIDTIFVAGGSEFEVGPAGVRMVPLPVRVEAGHGEPGSNRIAFHVHAEDDPSVSAEAHSTFFVPR